MLGRKAKGHEARAPCLRRPRQVPPPFSLCPLPRLRLERRPLMPAKLRVLVACEFSGVVRDAFRKRGHDAWSCDLLPTDSPGNHIQGDVSNVLDRGWDL